ncbi:MAG: periplasmic [NiFeSe] hydrogenase large subunit [Deferrisomatales bacterium]
MGQKVHIDPMTRIEGHLTVVLEMEGGKVVDAWSEGEMFRGFENILQGRDPRDAHHITQRICGVCPVPHGVASVKALDRAFGVTPPTNARIIRNLMQAGNMLQSHILHFYHLAALDYVDITAVLEYTGSDPALQKLKAWAAGEVARGKSHPVAPFLPRFKGDYIQDRELNIGAIAHYIKALELTRTGHEMAAIWGGKMPHVTSLVPGGVTEVPTAEKIAAYLYRLRRFQEFIDNVYLPDVIEVAKAYSEYFSIGAGPKNFLGYGIYELTNDGSETLHIPGAVIDGRYAPLDTGKIREYVEHSKYSSPSGLHPSEGQTAAVPEKEGAYSWVKAPRYDDQVMEVGALARMVVTHLSGRRPEVSQLVTDTLARFDADVSALFSVLGRHAARPLELKWVAQQVEKWLLELRPGEPVWTECEVPDEGEGYGLTEAQRGALGHWIRIQGGKIDNYQCVVPSTWNMSPRDHKGRRGAVEEALIGTPIADPENPIEACRVVRSFDPCLACGIHVIDPHTNEIHKFRVA